MNKRPSDRSERDSVVDVLWFHWTHRKNRLPTRFWLRVNLLQRKQESADGGMESPNQPAGPASSAS